MSSFPHYPQSLNFKYFRKEHHLQSLLLAVSFLQSDWIKKYLYYRFNVHVPNASKIDQYSIYHSLE